MEHRALKNVRVVNGSMVLKTRPHKEVSTAELEKHLDKTAAKGAVADVYEVNKIHDKRYVGGKAEYKCSWKGYNKNHKTWEPAKNLHEYGAGEILVEYEIAQSGGTKRSGGDTLPKAGKPRQQTQRCI